MLFFSGEEGAPGIIDRFFPAAGERDRPVPVLPGSKGGELATPGEEISSRLKKISEGRISGFHPIDEGVRYIERATGHVFESSPDGQKQGRVSGATIPGIFDSVWAFDGSSAVIKYREDENIRTASVKFSGTTTQGVLMPASIKSIDFAPDRKRLAYIAEVNGALVVIGADPDNTKQSELLRLPFADFEISWPTNKILSFITRPSGEAEGYLFTHNIDTGVFLKVFGGELGLEALWSPSGKKALLSVFDASVKRPQVSILDIGTKKTEDLQTATLARKCAWHPTDENMIYCAIPSSILPALYPDAWYKGEQAFNDSLWRINIVTLKKENVTNLPDIDIEEISVSPDGEHFYFQDKKEGALWSYQLSP